MKFEFGVLVLAMCLGGCASTAPDTEPVGASDAASADLACLLPSNCVNSRGTGDLVPLRYIGTPEQAQGALRATLATFPEATVVRAEPLALEAVFRTPVGFRDQVEFRIDARQQRIDFRSRSLFGLFDFGKNRARMQEFATRFEPRSRP